LRTTTIIIPSYNEAKRLPGFLSDLCFLTRERQDVYIVVSDDGSRPDQLAVIERAVSDLRRLKPQLEVRRSEVNKGKGAAIARVACDVQTDLVGFVDADGSINAKECVRLLDMHLQSLENAVAKGGPILSGLFGSRVKMLGSPVVRHRRRHIMGRFFATILSNLFGIAAYDTQCGCKFFLRTDLIQVMDHAYDERWLWDTQVVLLLYRGGYFVAEQPVAWHEVPGSKVSMIRDPIRMLAGLLRFRFYLATQMRQSRVTSPIESISSQQEKKTNVDVSRAS
jgi:glycosyltransferase involved in cell wall biosynthesis